MSLQCRLISKSLTTSVSYIIYPLCGSVSLCLYNEDYLVSTLPQVLQLYDLSTVWIRSVYEVSIVDL